MCWTGNRPWPWHVPENILQFKKNIYIYIDHLISELSLKVCKNHCGGGAQWDYFWVISRQRLCSRHGLFFNALLQLQWCAHHCCRPVVIHPDSRGTKGQPCLSGHIPAHLIESVMKDKRKLQFKYTLCLDRDIFPDSGNFSQGLIGISCN